MFSKLKFGKGENVLSFNQLLQSDVPTETEDHNKAKKDPFAPSMPTL